MEQSIRMLDLNSPAVPGLVSIVIPAYRSERFIGETLNSVAQQRYTNWELIVIEDDPNANSREIVMEFAEENPDHRVVYQCNPKNMGPSPSRNHGIGLSNGEFIALLDSDDRWLPSHLEKSIEALVSSNCDIAYSSVLMVEDETELLLGIWGPSANELRIFPHGLWDRNTITPSATILRRNVFEVVGGWEHDVKYCEDASLWLRCVAAGKSFVHIGGCHCLYRKNHAGSFSQEMAGMLESFAHVTERFLVISGIRTKTCRNYSSRAYARAAVRHQLGDSTLDRSVKRQHIAPLYYKAWRLRPKRIAYLMRSAFYHIKYC